MSVMNNGGIAGIVLWGVGVSLLLALVLFFLNRRESWSVKPRSPWLVVATCMFSFAVITIEVFSNAYPHKMPCTLPYFIHCTAVPAFFACYILRVHRLISLYQFSRVKATLIKYDAVAQTMAVKSPFSIRRYPVDAIQKIISNRNQYTELFYINFLILVWGTNTFIILCTGAAVWDHGLVWYCKLWVDNFTCVYVLLSFWVGACALIFSVYTLNKVEEGYKMKLELQIVSGATSVAAVVITGIVGGGYWWPATPYVAWIIAFYFAIVIGVSMGIPLYLSFFKATSEPSKKNDSEEGQNIREFLTGTGLHYFQEFLVREFAVENLMFYTEVGKFKQLTEINDMVKVATDIFNKFLAPNAAFMINASREDTNQIKKNLASPDNIIFDSVLDALIRDMESGPFPRFVQSDLYRSWHEGVSMFRPRVERIVV